MILRTHRSALFSAAFAALGICGLGCAAGAEGDEGGGPAIGAAKQTFEDYCFDCHGEGEKKGDFSLEALLQDGATDANRAQWQKAWKLVRQGFMPPAGAEGPDDPTRKKLTQWIEQERLGVDYANPDPGRVTIRRLNRMEYEYTVTDLFGVELGAEGDFSSDAPRDKTRLRDMLPPDDTAFGFDNIGDFQTLSPVLLEKYFDLAEFVADQLIVQDGPHPPARMLDSGAAKIVRDPDRKLVTHEMTFQVGHQGTYRVDGKFMLGGFQAYGGAFDFALDVDGIPLSRQAVENGGQKTYRPSGELALAPGEHRLVYTTDATKPNEKGDLVYLELRPKLRVTGPINAGLDEYPEAHLKIFFRGEAPADETARRAYAREIMQRIADRAFRRPTPAATLERLADLVMNAPKFEAGVSLGLMAILTSPKFLFRAEAQPQPDDPKAIHPLDEYALASRLSYFLWLSLPDEELRNLAAQGKLRENLQGQLRRMLADSKAERFFEDFPGQWLRTRNVLMTPVARGDAGLDGLRSAMKKETEMLFEDIARSDRDLLELVTANYTFLNGPLAKFYGVKDVQGDEFRKVQLAPESKRGGILTQASFLLSTSNPGRTSPVKRGLFVLENLLATQPPPPPPSIPALEDAKVDGVTPRTVRELLAQHRADKSCAACHAHFDPIGLVLENYDVAGRWRTTERGEPIEPNEKTVTGQTLHGVDDLKQLFVDRKLKFYQCVTEKLLTYALGRGLEPSDAVTVDRIADEVAAQGGKFSTLLTALVASPPFQTRRGDDGSLKIAPRLAMPAIPPPELRKGRRQQAQAGSKVEEPKKVVAPDSEAATLKPVENKNP